MRTNRKRRRLKRKFRRIIWIASLSVGVWVGFDYWQETTADEQEVAQVESSSEVVAQDEVSESVEPLTQVETMILSSPPQAAVDLSNVLSPAVLLLDVTEGTVLAERNSERVLFPASLTKMMTVLLGIEEGPPLTQTVVMKDAFFEGLYEQEAAVAGFQPEEVVTFLDLLYGSMLPSGADASRAIAEVVSGSEAAFVKRMNERAKELGMNQTHFENTTGLHHPKHVSTVSDLRKLVEVGLANETFYKIITTNEHRTKPTKKSKEGVVLTSTLAKYYYQYEGLAGTVLGGKSGFTEEAGLSLVTIAKIDEKTYALLTAGAGAQASGAGPDYIPLHQPFHVLDAVTIYNQLRNEIAKD